MNTKIKFIIPFLALILIFSFALACGGGEPSKEKLSIPKEEEAELKEVEKVEEAETKEVTVKQEGLQELKAGQEFIYDGRKIVLTKYELVETNIDKNLLCVYLYVENIDDKPHEHIWSEEFVIYHEGREDGILCKHLDNKEGRKGYDTGAYRELYPGEICEGWTSFFIDPDWKAEDIEIYFKPVIGGTRCIWVLK